jgi:hypothetical protein
MTEEEKRKFNEEESHFIPSLKRDKIERVKISIAESISIYKFCNLREGLRPPASPDPFRAFARALPPPALLPPPFRVPGDSGLSCE